MTPAPRTTIEWRRILAVLSILIGASMMLWKIRISLLSDERVKTPLVNRIERNKGSAREVRQLRRATRNIASSLNGRRKLQLLEDESQS
mmetsp:Transcript_5384/g.15823  ORF Transcript_5384/g.15823 Transcript_5384/m.15823 type:complete len:89 (-) Transcript_5384:333-599(-)